MKRGTLSIAMPEALKDDPVLSALQATVVGRFDGPSLIISAEGAGSFHLERGGQSLAKRLSRGALVKRVLAEVAEAFQSHYAATAIRCSAVAWRDRSALIFGHGKAMLTAWLVENGFSYVTDELVALNQTVEGLATPLTLAEQSASQLAGFADFGSAPMAKTGGTFLVSPKPEWLPQDGTKPGMLLFLNHKPRSNLRIEKLRADDAARRLKLHAKRDQDYNWLTTVTPAVQLTYSDFDQLGGVVDDLLRLVLGKAYSAVQFDKFAAAMPHHFAVAPEDIPTPSDRDGTCKLTIGMATYDDYDGVYFSIQAVRLFHPEILDQIEFIIIDNNPSGPCGPELKKLERAVPNLRYFPEGVVVGSTIKDRVFTKANGTFVLCMDSHVMFPPGTLQRLIDYFDANPETQNLLQGPLVYDDLKSTSSDWTVAVWSQGMLGKWHSDERARSPDNPPFEIEAQGMGVFACRKDAWPGFNPLFRGFGGEEVYIHGKFRKRGNKTLCLPFLRWLHRFGRPMGISYPNKWDDRIRNGLIGYDELGWDTTALVAHFQELLGTATANRIIHQVCEEFGWPATRHLKQSEVEK